MEYTASIITHLTITPENTTLSLWLLNWQSHPPTSYLDYQSPYYSDNILYTLLSSKFKHSIGKYSLNYFQVATLCWHDQASVARLILSVAQFCWVQVSPNTGQVANMTTKKKMCNDRVLYLHPAGWTCTAVNKCQAYQVLTPPSLTYQSLPPYQQ